MEHANPCPGASPHRASRVLSRALLVAMAIVFSACAGAPTTKPPEREAQDGRSIETLVRSGNVNFAHGRYAEAAADFTGAIRKGGGNATVHTARGRAYFEMGRYPEALADLDRAVELSPGSDTAWNTRGYILYSTGRYDEAARDLEKALAINPRHEAAYNHLGLVLLAQGRYGPALADFDKALDIDPGYYEVYANRGEALEKLGRTREAEDAYREYMKRANPSRDAKRAGQVQARLRALGSN